MTDRIERAPALTPGERLRVEGKLHWQECEVLSTREEGDYEYYDLRCPSCGKGTIKRTRDGTPGFKDASMTACDNCGLTGDGYELRLDRPATGE